MKTVSAIKIFLLGAVAALLLTVVLRDGKSALDSAQAQDHAVAGGVIALTAQTGSSAKTIGLVLIDTETKNMAYYLADEARPLRLVSTRHYGFDVGILELPFKSTGYDVFDEKELPKELKNVKSAKAAYDIFTKKAPK
ncbi:MAG: hypothetical protein J6333_04470 [Planctomycetes bacterium]|nr:hypothetical protein [Planctomycetota bacterium]